MTLAEQLRLQVVQRWNIVHTVKTQSVAEHSFNVVLIVREMCSKIPTIDPLDRKNLMIRALDHDMEEVFTGDLPSTSKSFKLPKNRLDGILKLADLIEAEYFLSQYGGHSKHTISAYIWLGERISEVLQHSRDMSWLGVAEAARQVRDELNPYNGDLYNGPERK